MSIHIKHPTDAIIPTGGVLNVSARQGLIIPRGSDAERPANLAGTIRFNTEHDFLEVYNTTSGWTNIPTGNPVTSITLSAGPGLIITNGTITQSGTIDISLTQTGVTPGQAFSKFTVDAYGRITEATSATLSDLSPPTTSVFFNSQRLTNLGAPVGVNDAASKLYVDNAILGLGWKDAVKVATTTQIGLSGEQTIDGVALVSGDRILVKHQTSAQFNGIYQVNPSDWIRTEDFDGTPGNEVKGGAAVFVQQGTTNGGTGWVMYSPAMSASIGTDDLYWVQFTAGGVSYNGQAGVKVSSLSIELDGQALTLHNFNQTGLMARTGAGTFAARTITGQTGRITVTNGDGITGNPDIDLVTTGISAGTYNEVTVDAYGRITGGNTINYLTNITTSAWGGGLSYISVSGNEINSKTLVAGGGIELSSTPTTIVISAKPLTGYLTEASAASLYVTLSSNQTITGLKTISNRMNFKDSDFYIDFYNSVDPLISFKSFNYLRFDRTINRLLFVVSAQTAVVFEAAGTTLTHPESAVTREKGDFRYIQNISESVLGTGEAVITTISGKSDIKHRSITTGGIIETSASTLEIAISANALKTITVSSIGGGIVPTVGVSSNPTSSEITFKTITGAGIVNVRENNNTIYVSAANVASKYVQTFNATTDWGTPSGGYYTIAILAANHNKGTNPIIQIYEQVGADFDLIQPDRIRVTSTGQIEFRVTEIPDNRFAGKYIII